MAWFNYHEQFRLRTDTNRDLVRHITSYALVGVDNAMGAPVFILQQAQRRREAHNDICWAFNESGCFHSICKFRHACKMCFGAIQPVLATAVGEGQSGEADWEGGRSGATYRRKGTGARYGSQNMGRG